MPKHALAAALLLGSVLTAYAAQFHIIRERTDGPCKITATRPGGGKASVIDGNKVYATWEEAYKDMRFVCRTG